MAIKYSEIRTKLKIESAPKEDDGIANLTHYLQNNKNGMSQFYKTPAFDYLTALHEELGILQKADLKNYLPVKWDVPFAPPEEGDFKFIDLFAGIGGIRLAYQNLGGKCVFSSEWNKFSKVTYEANFGKVPFGDITQISETEIPDHDVLLAGFPCQPFSIAGVSKKNALGRA